MIDSGKAYEFGTKSGNIYDKTLYGPIFYLGFLSHIFTIHRTAGAGGGSLLTSSLPHHLLHRHSDMNQAITAESSHSNREPLVSKRKSLTTKYGPCVKISVFLVLILVLEFSWYYCFLVICPGNVLVLPVQLSWKNQKNVLESPRMSWILVFEFIWSPWFGVTIFTMIIRISELRFVDADSHTTQSCKVLAKGTV